MSTLKMQDLLYGKRGRREGRQTIWQNLTGGHVDERNPYVRNLGVQLRIILIDALRANPRATRDSNALRPARAHRRGGTAEQRDRRVGGVEYGIVEFEGQRDRQAAGMERAGQDRAIGYSAAHACEADLLLIAVLDASPRVHRIAGLRHADAAPAIGPGRECSCAV